MAETPLQVRHDLNVVIGDTFPAGPPGTEFVILVKHKNAALDLTTTTVTAWIKERHSDSAATATFNVDVKDQVSNKGKVGLKLAPSETSKLVNRQYHWDLQVVWPDGTTITPVKGLVNAEKDVTS